MSDIEEQLTADAGDVGGHADLARDPDTGQFIRAEAEGWGLQSKEMNSGYRPIEQNIEVAIPDIEVTPEDLATDVLQVSELATPNPLLLYKDAEKTELQDPRVTLTEDQAGDLLSNYESASYIEGDSLQLFADIEATDVARQALVEADPKAAKENYGLDKAETDQNARLWQDPQQLEQQPSRPAATPDPQGLDPELARALSHPQVRAAIESELAQTAAQRTQYEAALSAISRQGFAALTALLPDIAAMAPEHRPGAFLALQQHDPARYQTAVARMNQLAEFESMRQAEFSNRTNARHAEQERARAFTAFESHVRNEDAKLEGMIGKDAASEANAALTSYLQANGVPRSEYVRTLMQNPALQTAEARNIIWKASQFDKIQNAPKAVAQRRAPSVQRPGSGGGRSAAEVSLASLEARLNATGSEADAWALLQARGRNR